MAMMKCPRLTDRCTDVRSIVLSGDEPLQRRLAHERVAQEENFVLDIERVLVAYG